MVSANVEGTSVELLGPGVVPKICQNKYTDLVGEQLFAIVSSFTLENGVTLTNVPVAYKTWGKLNNKTDNVMVLCHAVSGSSDAEDWWGPMMGPGLAFDPTRYYIFCANALGSPYGSMSPVTRKSEDSEETWAGSFPQTSIRDDVRIQGLILKALGVSSVAVVIGGSMGGMNVLEWPLMNKGYARHVCPVATCARHSAWGIAWGEVQRQCIEMDPNFHEGDYAAHKTAPLSGLANARLSAMLTYRSRDSFDARFGRRLASTADTNKSSATQKDLFSAQSYLRYQGRKFIERFDANCYIHLTRKLDRHDVEAGREGEDVFSKFPSGTLVVGVMSDGIFPLSEQEEIARRLPDAQLKVIDSPDGHDGFLLEFKELDDMITGFLKDKLPEIYDATPLVTESVANAQINNSSKGKPSLVSEAEGDITEW